MKIEIKAEAEKAPLRYKDLMPGDVFRFKGSESFGIAVRVPADGSPGDYLALYVRTTYPPMPQRWSDGDADKCNEARVFRHEATLTIGLAESA